MTIDYPRYAGAQLAFPHWHVGYRQAGTHGPEGSVSTHADRQDALAQVEVNASEALSGLFGTDPIPGGEWHLDGPDEDGEYFVTLRRGGEDIFAWHHFAEQCVDTRLHWHYTGESPDPDDPDPDITDPCRYCDHAYMSHAFYPTTPHTPAPFCDGVSSASGEPCDCEGYAPQENPLPDAGQPGPLTQAWLAGHTCDFTDDGTDPTPDRPACGRPATIFNPRGKSGQHLFDYDEWYCAKHADPAWVTA